MRRCKSCAYKINGQENNAGKVMHFSQVPSARCIIQLRSSRRQHSFSSVKYCSPWLTKGHKSCRAWSWELSSLLCSSETPPSWRFWANSWADTILCCWYSRFKCLYYANMMPAFSRIPSCQGWQHASSRCIRGWKLSEASASSWREKKVEKVYPLVRNKS